MTEYKFRVPYLPVSVNKMYSYNFGTRTKYLSKEASHFKSALKIACPPMKFEVAQPKLDIFIAYHSPKFLCKNGRYRKMDGPNMDKLIIDAICERIGYDDSLIFIWSGIKVIDQDEFTEVVVKEIGGQDVI